MCFSQLTCFNLLVEQIRHVSSLRSPFLLFNLLCASQRTLRLCVLCARRLPRPGRGVKSFFFRLLTVDCRLSTLFSLQNSTTKFAFRIASNGTSTTRASLPFNSTRTFYIRKSCQPPFKNFASPDRLARRNLRQPSTEALKIRQLRQRPVQSPADSPPASCPRARGIRSSTSRITLSCSFKRTGNPNGLSWDRGHARFLAPGLAKGRSAARTHRLVAAADCFGIRSMPHPQEPLLADFPFDINDFQAHSGARRPLGSFPDFLQIRPETPRPSRSALHCNRRPQQKSGLAAHYIDTTTSERNQSIFPLPGKARYGGHPRNSIVAGLQTHGLCRGGRLWRASNHAPLSSAYFTRLQ